MEFKSEEDYFKTFDGTRLFFRLYRRSNARHTMVVLHGHGEHFGRYAEFPKNFSDLPLHVAGFDLRGNGRSGGPEADLERFQDYLTDLSAFVEFLKGREILLGPDQLVLMGHSLGGLIALSWALENPRSLRALVLSAPLLGLKGSSLISVINRWCERLSPRWVYTNPVSPVYLSHDPVEVQRYRADPLIKRKMSARLLREILLQTRGLACRDPLSLPVPLLGLFAGRERIVDGKAGLKIFGRIQAREKEVRVYPDFYHEIFRETGREKVFADLQRFLQSQIA